MAAKTYEEFMAQETFNAVPLPEIGRYIWNAAIKSVEENGNSLQQLKEDICPECDGDGEVSWDIAKVKCSACKGTGIRSSI